MPPPVRYQPMSLSRRLLGVLVLGSAVPWLCAGATTATSDPAASTRTLHYPPVGDLTVYMPAVIDDRTDVVLFASGDGGWNVGVIEMANRLRQGGRLVVGFSTPQYLQRLDASKEPCAYPPQELEALSQFVQKQLGLKTYHTPMLVGYSSGATLTYLTLAQAPINAFRGGIAIGFCPELDLSKPLCRDGAVTHAPVRGEHGVRLDPVRRLAAPLAILQGEIDQVCSASEVADFSSAVQNATLTTLPRVGHGFSVYANWFPQMLKAYAAIDSAPKPTNSADQDMDGLPLVESRGSGRQPTLVIMLSGDGGWSSLTQKIAADLNQRGYPVLGWSSLQYFWEAKSAAQASADLARVIQRYLAQWQCRDVILSGYSLGADVLPGMVERLPDSVRRQLRAVVLLAPGRTTDFAFHFSGWFQKTAAAPPILPAAESLARRIPLTCIYGREEADTSLCTQLGSGTAAVRALPGAHHFDGDYAAVVELILGNTAAATRTSKPSTD